MSATTEPPFPVLLPHQSAFVATVLDSSSAPIVILRAAVGLGKGVAMAALARSVLQGSPSGRVLFLVPAPLCLQSLETLRRAGAPALLVDRYVFRERLDSDRGDELWPRGMAVVMSIDLARQRDVLERLERAKWALLVADEAPGMRGPRADALRRVAGAAKKTVLSVLTGVESPSLFPGDGVTLVEWNRESVVDHAGQPLLALPRPLVRAVRFSLSPGELALFRTLDSLQQVAGASSTQGRLMARTVMERGRSSPAALEATLLQFAETVNTRLALRDAPAEGEFEEDTVEPEAMGRGELAASGGARALVQQALLELDAVGKDSKLSALTELLSGLEEAGARDRSICVISEFQATLYYLAAEMESRGVSPTTLHGGMSFGDRARGLAGFLSGGGIMVATRGVMSEGVALPDVTDLILYDVPMTRSALVRLLGRFDRFGRRTRLVLHVLAPLRVADWLGADPLQLPWQVLEGRPGETDGVLRPMPS